MTSTPVKDVGSILTNLTPGAGNRTTGIGQSGFQAVLDNQAQRNMNQNTDAQTAESKSSVNRPDTGKKPGDSLKAKNTDKVQSKETEELTVDSKGEEMTPQDVEEAMAVLETAAADLIRQTADVLGISVEEVQSLMADMGMEELDILDPTQLSALFLQVNGVEDSYALITDEGLYQDYQTLMRQLETTLQDCSRQLDVEPVQVPALLEKLQERPVVQNETPVVEVSQEKGDVFQAADQMPVQTSVGMDERKDDSTDSREQKESRSDDKEPSGGNLLIQNLKTEEFRPEVQQTEDIMHSAETETENIMRQIMDYMKIQLKADTSSLEMQLHPASLGTVQVQIASRGGAVTANFIAQNETVKAALESQMVQLMDRFEEQGVKVEAVEVTVQTHEFERNLDQGRGREQQSNESAKKGRTRRIDLNDALSMENMEEEDALAADMMAASGNTVDYTA